MSKPKLKVIISGGGTGGHIFPALSIADALRRTADADILFVGAENRMEMERVPAAGYPIEGLPVAGFDRKRPWRNFGVLLKLWRSMRKARRIVREFKPDVAVGVGGYASGPVLKAAQKAGIPALLQEQNSYAGVTNKLLARKARRICVAWPGMERFFPAKAIVMTGNPVRRGLLSSTLSPAEARNRFGLNPDKPTLLSVGGSLGALTINEAMAQGLHRLVEAGVQVIWQTGKSFEQKALQAAKGLRGVVVAPFITDMAAAYAAASLVVSRAGASSISELELLAKPAILVPSPNVAEDHQTKNARALSSRGAAVLIPDADARQQLVSEALRLLSKPEELAEMSRNVAALALTDSDSKIASIVLELASEKSK